MGIVCGSNERKKRPNIKDKYISSGINSLSLEQISYIKKQMEQCICKFKNFEKINGFLCKISFPNQNNLLPVLIISNYLLIKNEKNIYFSTNNDKINYTITIDKTRKIYGDETNNLYIIEIKKDDGIDIDTFLEIDEDIYKNEKNKDFNDIPIYLIYYSDTNNPEFSLGSIKIITNKNNFDYFCANNPDTFGIPIINLLNYKIIGIKKESNKEIKINKGIFIKPVIDILNNKLIEKDIIINGNNQNDLINNLITDMNTNEDLNDILDLDDKENNNIEKSLIQIKEKENKNILISEKIYSQKEIESFYNKCLSKGETQPDEDFSIETYKKYYPEDDPFFQFVKGEVDKRFLIFNPDDIDKIQIYEGEMNKNNKRHGYGICTTSLYVRKGIWQNDEFTGWGRESRRNGEVLEGKFIKGKINGKGILQNRRGNLYTGDLVDSKRDGYGELHTNKIHYIGYFKEDKLCGKGSIEFLKEGHKYEGEFRNNQINGKGIFKWNNGDIYEGMMENGKMNGYGIYKYSDGVIFEGEYKNGIKEGKGKIINNNQIIYEGEFKEGHRVVKEEKL